MEEHRSIEEIEGRPWPQPVPDAPAWVVEFHRARRTPIDQLSVGDLQLLFEQGVGREFLLPVILVRLQGQPLVGDGELLRSVLEHLNARLAPAPADTFAIKQLLGSIPAGEVEQFSLLELAIWQFEHDHG